jgi:hypothetical protein
VKGSWGCSGCPVRVFREASACAWPTAGLLLSSCTALTGSTQCHTSHSSVLHWRTSTSTGHTCKQTVSITEYMTVRIFVLYYSASSIPSQHAHHNATSCKPSDGMPAHSFWQQ